MTPEEYLGSIYLNSKLDPGQGLSEHTSPEALYVNLPVSISHCIKIERKRMGEEGERQGIGEEGMRR
jgi:hypothetical protein